MPKDVHEIIVLNESEAGVGAGFKPAPTEICAFHGIIVLTDTTFVGAGLALPYSRGAASGAPTGA
jgi:hypothetical protein